MRERPRFVVDVMLGRLAKWLRLLGYDTLYFRESDDHDLARLARAEDRILLTRDVQLTKRRGVHAVWIENELIAPQLREVFKRLQLEANVDSDFVRAAAEHPRGNLFSRCPECNRILNPVERQAVREKIPPYVYETHTYFRECPNCGRVFWRGSHWARIVAEIENAQEP